MDQYVNTVGLEFDLHEMIAELAARELLERNSHLVELGKYFNNLFKKNSRVTLQT